MAECHSDHISQTWSWEMEELFFFLTFKPSIVSSVYEIGVYWFKKIYIYIYGSLYTFFFICFSSLILFNQEKGCAKDVVDGGTKKWLRESVTYVRIWFKVERNQETKFVQLAKYSSEKALMMMRWFA